MAAVGGTKDAALFIGAVGMAFGGDEEAVWILRIDENRRDLLGVAKVLHVRPGFTRVGGFIDSVAGGEIRALQSFAAADINNVRIGRGDGESADGAGGLIVENGIPGVAEVRGFPDAAVDGGHVKQIGLVPDAGEGALKCAPTFLGARLDDAHHEVWPGRSGDSLGSGSRLGRGRSMMIWDWSSSSEWSSCSMAGRVRRSRLQV